MRDTDPVAGDVAPALTQDQNICSICDKSLSRYNKTGQCFHHLKPNRALMIRERRERQEEAARVAEAMREELRQLEMEAGIEKKNVSTEVVLRLVREYFSVSEEALKEPGRQLHLVRARHVLMYLLYLDTDMSYPDIGELLGGRDHTTVLHGVQKLTKEMETDVELQAITRHIRSQY